jgi:hypothetical protein
MNDLLTTGHTVRLWTTTDGTFCACIDQEFYGSGDDIERAVASAQCEMEKVVGES